MTVPAGWTATNSANASGGHTGNWNWTLTGNASLDQLVANLPSGTYTLSAWVKSSGGQTAAALYAKNFGDTDKTASVSAAMKNWSQVSITGIAVSNGQCNIGVTTTGSSSQSVNVDDFTLVRTGP